ncbi:LysR substrate-binding domain-containing protein [Rahnella inusitata]|uniref:LysR family transcriptional regulator n=1 Tax=Rahnella inusitata TaxID=58169 RepID=UPI0039BEA0A7
MRKLGNIRRLAYFVSVVEAGSFTAAAERLGITKAVVSHQVARLEEELNTTLLIRTTRTIRLTDAGKVFYEHCASILRETEEAFAELDALVAEPSGTLRLTAPFDYGISVVVPAITAFSQRYPDCKVDAVISDNKFDIVDKDIEIAIRVGWLDDSHLQARKIGHFRQLLIAPRNMQPQVEKINKPQDIKPLPFIANTALREPSQWHFTLNGSDQQSINVQPSIFINNTLAVREAVREGAGISVLPDYVVSDDLISGRLIQVLPEWELPSGEIHAVFPASRFRPTKVRSFLNILIEKDKER